MAHACSPIEGNVPNPPGILGAAGGVRANVPLVLRIWNPHGNRAVIEQSVVEGPKGLAQGIAQ